MRRTPSGRPGRLWTVEDQPDVELNVEERAAVRAYLQRCEVRLSTLHRVATALLSGAGLMVLFPVVGRDAVVEVLRNLSTGTVDAPKAALLLSVVLVLSVPVVSLMVVLRDLTGFYFYTNHIPGSGGGIFVPRFTLTGLQLPSDELGPTAAAELQRRRSAPESVGLLVPDNAESRARADQRIAAYGGLEALGRVDPGGEGRPAAVASSDSSVSEEDLARAEAKYVLAASRSRTLLEEVAKVEAGIVRHVLRIQVIVLRYVKALLALLTTALAVFAAAAVVEGKQVLGHADMAWLAAVHLVWAPLVVLAVSTPVGWLDRLLRNVGASTTGAREDPAFTHVEEVTVRLALLGWVAAFVAMVVALADDVVSSGGRALGIAVLVVTAAALFVILRIWGEGAVWRRVTARG